MHRYGELSGIELSVAALNVCYGHCCWDGKPERPTLLKMRAQLGVAYADKFSLITGLLSTPIITVHDLVRIGTHGLGFCSTHSDWTGKDFIPVRQR